MMNDLHPVKNWENKPDLEVCETRILPVVESPKHYHNFFLEISIDKRFYILYSDLIRNIEDYVVEKRARIIGEIMVQ